MLDRVLATCGFQVGDRLEPLLADVEAQVDRMLAGPVELHVEQVARIARSLEDRDDQGGLLPAHRMARSGPVTWALDGASALAVQGLAADHPAPHVAVVLDEALRFWLRAVGLRGTSPKGWELQESWLKVEDDVLKGVLPGLQLSRVGMIQVRVVDELPVLLRVVVPTPTGR